MGNYLLFAASSMLSVLSTTLFFKRFQLRAGTGFRATVCYLIANGVFSAIVPAAILLFGGKPIELTWCSFVYAFALVMVSVFNDFFSLRAYASGQMAIASTFNVIGSMSLSCIWGIAFLQEELKALQIGGIALIVLAILLFSKKSGSVSAKTQWINLVMLAATSGAIQILSKMHQIESVLPTAETMSFSVWIGVIRAVIFAVLAPFAFRYLPKEQGTIDKQSVLLASVHSLIVGSIYIVTLTMAKILPITVTTPLSTGLSMGCSALFSFLFWKEKLNRAELCAIALSLAGVLMLVA